MLPRQLYPEEYRRRRAARRPVRTVETVQVNPAFRVSAAELAAMHPLLRSVIGALTEGAVETTTLHDGDGRVISVRTKRKAPQHSARTIQSLLNSARALIDLEREIATGRSTRDLDDRADATPLHDPT